VVFRPDHSGKKEEEEKEGKMGEEGDGEDPTLPGGRLLSMAASAAATLPPLPVVRGVGGLSREAEKEKKCVEVEEEGG